MQRAHHIDMTVYAMMMLRWPKAVLPLASRAEFPDTVREIKLAGFGAHVFGHNLSSFTHFGFGRGYCWQDDGSVAVCRGKYVLDLPDYRLLIGREFEEAVGAKPGSSPTHRVDGKLIEDAVFPAATEQIDWLHPLDHPVAAMSVVHLVQDLFVPHHREAKLLDGHSTYEARLYSEWLGLRHVATAERRPILDDTTREAGHDPFVLADLTDASVQPGESGV
ncbi:MAG: hypothetical protein ABID40_03100, partial [Candidatus Bipolaricaulota bacterium]